MPGTAHNQRQGKHRRYTGNAIKITKRRILMIKTHQVNGTLHITLSGQLAISTVYELTVLLAHVADSW